MTPVRQQSGQNDIIPWPGYKCRPHQGSVITKHQLLIPAHISHRPNSGYMTALHCSLHKL